MNKRILVIGSSGFLGRQIVSLLEADCVDVIRTHYQNRIHENSIKFDFFNDDIRLLLDQHAIELIIFTGMVEFNPEPEVKTAIKRFARASQNRRIVYLSSDGIFDGEQGLYSETDIPKPVTLYGRNLDVCEETLKTHCSNLCIVRPSYIYGYSNGTLDHRLQKTRQLLEAGEEVFLFDDMVKSPLGVKQIAQAVIDLAELGHVGIVHVAGERLNVYEFNQQAMAALGVETSGLKPNKMPVGREGFLRDTSLDSTLWKQLTGTEAMTVEGTLLQDLG